MCCLRNSTVRREIGQLDVRLPRKEIIYTDGRTDRHVDGRHDRRTDGQTSRTTTISSFFRKNKKILKPRICLRLETISKIFQQDGILKSALEHNGTISLTTVIRYILKVLKKIYKFNRDTLICQIPPSQLHFEPLTN